MTKEFIKYSNRKVYLKSTTYGSNARYYSVDELVKEIKTGNTISVKCHLTNEDVTARVLRQALLKAKFDVETLCSLIEEYI